MGKVEKVVFLSVLLLMVVIIAVSIPDGDGSDVNQDRIYTASKDSAQEGSRLRDNLQPKLPSVTTENWRAATGAKPAPEAQPEVQPVVQEIPKSEPVVIDPLPAPAPSGSGGTGLLSAGVMTAPVVAPEKVAPVALPVEAGWDLVSTQGLERTNHPEFLIYACVAGDRYETLAARFYGSADQAAFLRLNNEGLDQLTPGVDVLVPVFKGDTLQRSYTVRPGDSLWTIARDLYGDGAKWRELFDANRGRLESPDALRAGLELLIP
ncbi:MAG: LysM peptidoglycan-binding domain-containing protein [Planctomycetota bacterium]